MLVFKFFWAIILHFSTLLLSICPMFPKNIRFCTFWTWKIIFRGPKETQFSNFFWGGGAPYTPSLADAHTALASLACVRVCEVVKKLGKKILPPPIKSFTVRACQQSGDSSLRLRERHNVNVPPFGENIEESPLSIEKREIFSKCLLFVPKML